MNKLSLNCKKSKTMFFGTKQQVSKTNNIKTHCGGQELEVVQKYKYLGMILDSELNFKANAEYIVSKVIPRLGILGRARAFVRAPYSICTNS